MKALVLESIGKLVYRDVPRPCPRPGEVLLSVKACGICSSDFDRCLKTGAYQFPLVPGHEFSGLIEDVGDGVDRSLIGTKAAVFPLLPCGCCDQCCIGAYARCRNYRYFGSRCDGAFAEYVCVPEWNLQRVDSSLSYEVAALCEPAAVAWHAVSSAPVLAQNKICVVGTGTIGILVGIWARQLGGNVTFVVRNPAKRAFLYEMGFSDFVSANEATACEVVFECVGSDESLTTAINCSDMAATVVLVGNPDKDKTIPRNVYWAILRKELTIKGVWNSCRSRENNEWQKVVENMTAKKELFLRLITSKFSLATGMQAFEALKSGKKVEIKGMFVNE